MKATIRERDGVSIIELKGKITIGVGDVAFRETVHKALETGAKKLVVNLGEVTTIDSSGIGELVAAFTTVSNRGGKLRLCKIPPKVDDILQITQLIQVFDIHDDEDEAIAAFTA